MKSFLNRILREWDYTLELFSIWANGNNHKSEEYLTE